MSKESGYKYAFSVRSPQKLKVSGPFYTLIESVDWSNVILTGILIPVF